MAATPKRGSNILQFAAIFAVVYLGSQFILSTFFPDQFGNQPSFTGVKLTASSVTVGHHVVVTVENRTGSGIVLPSRCPRPPLDIVRVESDQQLQPLQATGSIVRCSSESVVVPDGEKEQISLRPWKYSLLENVGTYEARLPDAVISESTTGSGQTVAAATVRFQVKEPGTFTKLFRTFILAPLFNFLIFIAALLPGHNLGLAIILLTLIIKALLYIPTQHALEGQKKMQLLQPKIEVLKQKYPNDPKKMQEETMKLWAEHKINPFQSCLPTLVQMPILIGLYYAVQEGAGLEYARHLLYPVYQNLSWTFETTFLGLDLLTPNIYLMPILLVALQFLQMKLAFAIQARKTKKAAQSKEEIIDVPVAGEKPKKKPASAQDMQQRVMLYGLPLMIGFFAIQFPAAVSLYWGISTLFGIGQQILVNREHLRV